MDNIKKNQMDLIHILTSLYEIAITRGLIELEKYGYLTGNYSYLSNALEMITKGTDPEIVWKHLSDLVESENDIDTKLLKKIVQIALSMIQSGSGSPFILRLRLFMLVDPDIENLYFEKHLKLERRKNEFFSTSILFKIDPELVNKIETIFLYKIIGGNPADLGVIDYRTIAISLLGCSRAMQIKVFEYFPFIEAEIFLDYYNPDKITEADVIKAMNEIEEHDRKEQISRRKAAEWQRKNL